MNIRFFIFFLAATTICAMDRAVINKALREAIVNFDLKSDIPTVQTAESSKTLWSYFNGECIFCPDAFKNADLLTFASYWTAASVANNTDLKVRIANKIGLAVTCLPLAPVPLVPAEYRPVALVAGGAVTMLLNLWAEVPEIFAKTAEHWCDQQSFGMACDKLLVKGKYDALVTYYSYLHIIGHNPLSKDEKEELIKHVAKKRYLYFDSNINNATTPKKITSSIRETHSRKSLLSKTLSFDGQALQDATLK